MTATMNAWAWLYRYYDILWRKRIYLLIPVIIMPLIGYQVGRSIPDTYYSHTTILLQERNILNPILAELSLPLNIQSRFKTINILAKRKQVLKIAATQAGLITSSQTDAQQRDVIKQIKQSLTLSLTGTDLIEIAMTWQDPLQLTIILNVISEQFILRLTKPNQDIALNSKVFLADQLKQQHKLLLQAEQALFDYQFTHTSIIPELYEARETALISINKEHKNRAHALNLLQSKLSLLTKKLILTNPAAQFIDNKITQLETLKIKQLAHYTELHSKVKTTEQQISNLQSQRQTLQAERQDQQSLELLLKRITRLPKQVFSTQITPLLLNQINDYEQYKTAIIKTKLELQKLNEQQTYFQTNQAGYLQIEQELQRLKRDTETKKTVYLDLLMRYEMVSISYELGEYESGSNVKIITEPYTPEQAINLSSSTYILLGLLLGLIQGIAISLTLSATQDTLWNESKIVKVTGLKVIARVPLISPDYPSR